MKSLHSWSGRRIALVWLAWPVLAAGASAAAVALWVRHEGRREAEALAAAHAGGGGVRFDTVVVTTVEVGPVAPGWWRGASLAELGPSLGVAGLLVGPPLLLTGAWLRARRRDLGQPAGPT